MGRSPQFYSPRQPECYGNSVWVNTAGYFLLVVFGGVLGFLMETEGIVKVV